MDESTLCLPGSLKMAQDTSGNCNASLMSFLHNPADKKKKKTPTC